MRKGHGNGRRCRTFYTQLIPFNYVAVRCIIEMITAAVVVRAIDITNRTYIVACIRHKPVSSAGSFNFSTRTIIFQLLLVSGDLLTTKLHTHTHTLFTGCVCNCIDAIRVNGAAFWGIYPRWRCVCVCVWWAIAIGVR